MKKKLKTTDTTIDELLIPKERVGVLIGKKGEVKRKIERECGVKLEIDSEEGEVMIERPSEGSQALDGLKGLDIIRAIARGFAPAKAFKLLKPNICIDIIDLTDYVSKKSMRRVKSRLIGAHGKSRSYTSRLTKTEIVIYGKTVSLIGELENVEIAKRGLMKLVKGSSHSSVFTFLERNRL
ncbi:MAG: KH domain-containing protein [Candidatus Micrarchaeota archaeon]